MAVTRLDNLEQRMTKIEQDVSAIKISLDTIDDMADTVRNLCTWIKRGLPLVATAAVTSGLVSGKWGDFFHALFN